MITLAEFLKKNEIQLDLQITNICYEGIELMSSSIDPLHDQNHVFRLFKLLDSLINSSLQVKKQEINWNILIPALCWHDTWKSRRVPTGPFSVIVDQLWDGLGSMKLFERRAKELGLNKKTIDSIKYVIRKHAKIQFLKRNTIEAKVMNDIDRLDEFSPERSESIRHQVFNPENINRRIYYMGLVYWHLFLKKKSTKTFYYDWSKEEFLKIKDKMIDIWMNDLENYRLALQNEHT